MLMEYYHRNNLALPNRIISKIGIPIFYLILYLNKIHQLDKYYFLKAKFEQLGRHNPNLRRVNSVKIIKCSIGIPSII